MFNPKDITLAVLAGGESRRMGVPKSHLQLDGGPILASLLKRLAWPGPTLLVTAPGRQHPPGAQLFNAEAVDPVAGQGPLRGVLTALQNTTTQHLIVIPVDMPALTSEVLLFLASTLLESGKCISMFMRDQHLEPLPAAFKVADAMPIVNATFQHRKGAMRNLSNSPQAMVAHFPDSWPKSLWVNLNHPQDVKDYTQAMP